MEARLGRAAGRTRSIRKPCSRLSFRDSTSGGTASAASAQLAGGSSPIPADAPGSAGASPPIPSPKPAYHEAPSKRESYFSAIDGGRRRSGLGLRLRVASRLRSRSRSRWRFSRSCSRSRSSLSRRSRRSKFSRPRSRSRSSRRRGGLRERDRRGLRGLPRRPWSSTRSLMSSTGPMPSSAGPFVEARRSAPPRARSWPRCGGGEGVRADTTSTKQEHAFTKKRHARWAKVVEARGHRHVFGAGVILARSHRRFRSAGGARVTRRCTNGRVETPRRRARRQPAKRGGHHLMRPD